ncbi:aminotransferase class V-fold PLP-dependent enzyme [Streptomyces sp. B93]|uniref:pyridoxal phosphate-dependent decarboxylase family protein n=1 Tax=Streptomyces sp. B93 TaxID=2824875 RepID=UPI001B379653|nr:aminotransferase class V-fold PLP-dependent enzyme [Streptomyces sp. B93]MBQ1089357.1 aspartate aminotransferase family protein [Streptomyces sp. B93]
MPTEPEPTPAPALPKGRPAAELLAELRELRGQDAPTRGGRTFAYVYDAGVPGLDDLAAEAYRVHATVNGLDPTVFPSVLRLENDLVGAVNAVLGRPGAQGTLTSGGTESILLAVKTARDHARAERGVTRPQLVLPATAHAAFHKAAHYLGLETVTVPVDPETFRPAPADVAAALTDRTALVVASAPSYAHGVMDPVAEIAAAAAERDVLCHVDACVGGWFLPFLARTGRPVAPFDLTVPGVTSLSVDLHKYGYADKGASVVLYRDAHLRRHQYFAHARWPGYPVVNPTVQGTRPAGLAAQAWAVLHHLGDDGYTELTRQVADAADRLLPALRALPDVRVLGEPVGNLVAFTVTGPDATPDLARVLHMADEMRERGWYLQPQLAYGALPPNLHLTLTPATAAHVPALLNDLTEALTGARAAVAPVTVDPQLLALAAALDPDTLTPEEVAAVLAFADLGGEGRPPTRMAPVLMLLDALPVRLKERLMTEYVSALFQVRP